MESEHLLTVEGERSRGIKDNSRILSFIHNSHKDDATILEHGI